MPPPGLQWGMNPCLRLFFHPAGRTLGAASPLGTAAPGPVATGGAPIRVAQIAQIIPGAEVEMVDTIHADGGFYSPLDRSGTFGLTAPPATRIGPP